jgi:hypothetical protein
MSLAAVKLMWAARIHPPERGWLHGDVICLVYLPSE